MTGYQPGLQGIFGNVAFETTLPINSLNAELRHAATYAQLDLLLTVRLPVDTSFRKNGIEIFCGAVVPRRTGDSTQDVTSFHPGQARWSLDHFSNVMYTLKPPLEWVMFSKSQLPRQKREVQGNSIWVDHPKLSGQRCELLDFKIWPTKV